MKTTMHGKNMLQESKIVQFAHICCVRHTDLNVKGFSISIHVKKYALEALISKYILPDGQHHW